MTPSVDNQAGHAVRITRSAGLSLERLQQILEQSERYSSYTVIRKLGQGGTASIFLVRHPHLNELRAIKVLQPNWDGTSEQDLSRARHRFIQEAQLARHSKHDGLVEIFDVSILPDGTALLEMEYLDGQSVAEHLRHYESGLPIFEAVEIICQTLEALQHLHELGFVHRDISPDNLMLLQWDGSLRVKLIDLGIASPIGETSPFEHGLLGKHKYSAPEIWAGDFDGRSDLYSLGVVFYELVTGKSPFEHACHLPHSFGQSDPQGRVPEGLKQIIMKMLAYFPTDRPASAAELQRELEAWHDAMSRSLDDAGDLSAEGRPEEISLGQIQQLLDLEFPMETSDAPRAAEHPVARVERHQDARPAGRRQRQAEAWAIAREALRQRRLQQLAVLVETAVKAGHYAAAHRLIHGARCMVPSTTSGEF